MFWSTYSTVKTEINLFQTGDNLWLWSDCSPVAGVCQSYVATLLSDCHPVTEAKLYKIIVRYRTQGSSKHCENWNLNGNLNLSLSSKRLLYSAVIHLINFRGSHLKRKWATSSRISNDDDFGDSKQSRLSALVRGLILYSSLKSF